MAHLRNNFGGKHFVLAIWHIGLTWAPSKQMIRNDADGALEHAGINFACWIRCVARAVYRHKKTPNTIECRIRSGSIKGQRDAHRNMNRIDGTIVVHDKT